jgi:hypothetical protein
MFCGGQDGVRRARAHRGHEVNNYVTGASRAPTRYPTTHQRCPRAWSRALVAHPHNDLRPVDDVWVRRERHRRERLAHWAATMCW